MSDPTGVWAGPAGTVYIADPFNHRIRRVAGGIITTVAGNGAAGFAGDGGPGVLASMNLPRAIVLDPDGALVIADTGNLRIRRVESPVP